MLSLNRKQAILRVLILTFGLNLIIACSKLIYGYFTGTMSMIADGFHSLMDGSSNVIGFVAIGYAFDPPDKEHPYGHRKAEVLASMGISVLLVLTCVEVGRELIGRLLHPSTPEVNIWSFVIMGVGLLINIGVVWYEARAGKELQSQILSSDAEHTRSDILVTLAVIGSLIGISLKWYWLDLVVSSVIIGVIAKIAWEIFLRNFQILVDHMPVESEKIKQLAESVPGIFNCHNIKAHGLPDEFFMELHIWVNPDLKITEAHELAHQAKRLLLEQVQGLSDVTIHIEPIMSSEHDEQYAH